MFLEAAANDPIEWLRNGAAARRELGDVLLQDRRHRFGGGVALERTPAGEHLEQHRAQREDVGAVIDPGAAHLLGRHVADRAENHARLGPTGHRRRVGAGALGGQPEVEDLDAAVARDEEVVRLQIAMHDLLVVRGGQADGDLDADLDRLARRGRSSLEPLPQRLALEQLRHGIGRSLVHADVMNGEDVRVRERRDRLGFALEAGAAIRVLRNQRRKDLDGDVAIETGVAGAIHLAHPAFTERAGHDIRTEARAGAKASHGVHPS